MITIIHGDNTDASRVQLSELKSTLGNITTIEGSSASRQELLDFFSGQDMFVSEKNLVIENLLSKNRPSKNLDSMISALEENSKNAQIILWEEKEITVKALSQFPQAKAFSHKIPKLIFNFLDAIVPGNGETLVRLFYELIKNTSIEIVLFMMVRQLRLLIALSSKESDSIDELSKMAPWQRGKMHKQAELFTSVKLISLYNKLYEIDSSSKTGKLSMSLPSAIDILLLSELNS